MNHSASEILKLRLTANMKRAVLICSVLSIWSLSSLAQDRQPDFQYRPLSAHLLKLSPAFNGSSLKGASLHYETGLFHLKLSTQVSARYFAKISDNETRIAEEIAAHFRFELQFRIWPSAAFDGFFLSPLFQVYSGLDFGAGAIIGYQYFINKLLFLEASIGLTSSSSFDQFFDAKVIPRFGISLGFYVAKN